MITARSISDGEYREAEGYDEDMTGLAFWNHEALSSLKQFAEREVRKGTAEPSMFLTPFMVAHTIFAALRNSAISGAATLLQFAADDDDDDDEDDSDENIPLPNDVMERWENDSNYTPLLNVTHFVVHKDMATLKEEQGMKAQWTTASDQTGRTAVFVDVRATGNVTGRYALKMKLSPVKHWMITSIEPC